MSVYLRWRQKSENKFKDYVVVGVIIVIVVAVIVDVVIDVVVVAVAVVVATVSDDFVITKVKANESERGCCCCCCKRATEL